MHASNRKRSLALTLSASLLLPLLLSALVEFSCWSVLDEVVAERSSHLGMTGPMTVLTTADIPQEADTPARATRAALALRSYLQERSLSVVVSPADDGYPGLQYYAPPSPPSSTTAALAWARNLPSRCREEHHACLVRGSWSQLAFDRHSPGTPATPLVDPSLRVSGILDISGVSVDDIQYVTPLGSVPLVAGTAVIGTTDPETIRHIVRLLSSAGQEVQSSQSIIRESTALLHDSSVMMSGLLLLCGAFCAMECWFVLMGEQGRDFAIRRLFGARTSQIVGQFLRNEVPHILVSTLCGSALTLAAIIPSGQLRDVSFGHIPAVLTLPLLTFVLSSLLTCALEALCCGWACHTASPVNRPERTRRSHHASAR